MMPSRLQLFAFHATNNVSTARADHLLLMTMARHAMIHAAHRHISGVCCAPGKLRYAACAGCIATPCTAVLPSMVI